LGKYDEAMADIGKAISIDPNYYWAYYTRGLIYEVMGEADKASADFKYACDNGEDEACEKVK